MTRTVLVKFIHQDHVATIPLDWSEEYYIVPGAGQGLELFITWILLAGRDETQALDR